MTDKQVLEALRDAAGEGQEVTTEDLYNRITRKQVVISVSAMWSALDRLEAAGDVVSRDGYMGNTIKHCVRLSDKQIPMRPDPVLLEEALISVVDERL